MSLPVGHRVVGRPAALALLLTAATVLGGLAVSAPAAAAPRGGVQLVAAPKVKLLRAVAPSGRRPRALRAPSAGTAVAPGTPRPQLSTWNVTYRGFEPYPQAKQAFQAAVDTWATLVASSVPIAVSATFRDLGDPTILGQAGPTDLAVLDRDGNGTPDTGYPLALANAIEHRDLSLPTSLSDGSDITAEFNDNAGRVYYGTDGVVPPGYVDFETVVLHELCHGLGFLGSMTVDSAGRGSYGTGTSFPTIYDRFAVRSAGALQGKPLLSYPNHSLDLGTAITSGAVYWNGAYAKAAYAGRPPRLYAPFPFEAASSYSHLSDVDFPVTDANSLMTPFVEESEVIRDPGPVPLGMFSDMGWGTPQPTGDRYTPADPVRVLDTRVGVGALGRLGQGQQLDVAVVGGGTSVPATATAVILNVTGVGPQAATDLRVFPTPRSGSARPLVSNLNLAAGDVRANLVTVGVGDGGRVRIYNSGGSVHVLADVQGWYAPQAQSTYEPTDPVRIADTRTGAGGVAAGPVIAGAPLDVRVTGGVRAVPDSASAVVLTVTALHATTGTDVGVYPVPADPAAAPPDVSTLNLAAGQVVANLVTVKTGAGGMVRLAVRAGAVDLVIDLAGWYDQSDAGALFHVLGPQRLLDTRSTSRRVLGPAQTIDLPVTGVSAIPTAAARAVVLNVTGVAATRSTDIDAYPAPADGGVPLVSTLNLIPRQTAADLAIVQVGLSDGQGRSTVRLRNAAGNVGLVVDVAGWFGSY